MASQIMEIIFFSFYNFFGLLLNLGINKIVVVELQKNIVELIKQSLKLSLNIIFIIILIDSIIIFIFKKYFNVLTIGVGLSITVFI